MTEHEAITLCRAILAHSLGEEPPKMVEVTRQIPVEIPCLPKDLNTVLLKVKAAVDEVAFMDDLSPAWTNATKPGQNLLYKDFRTLASYAKANP